MLLANFDSIFEYRSITFSIGILTWLMVQSVDSSCDFLHETAVYKLTHLKVAAAVGALLSLLGKPLFDAVSAAKLRARRTENGILDLAITDETLEDFLDVLIGI